MTVKLMTSQVVQRARPLITHICVVGIQRVNESVLLIEKKNYVQFPLALFYTIYINYKPFILAH